MSSRRHHQQQTNSGGVNDPANPAFGPEVVIPPSAVENDTTVTVGHGTAHPPTLSSMLPQIMASLFAKEQAQQAADAAFASALRDVSVLLSVLQLTTQLGDGNIRQSLQKAVLTAIEQAARAIQPH